MFVYGCPGLSETHPAVDAAAAPAPNELLYGLNARPPLVQAVLAAFAHLLAIVAGIATAPLLIARGLHLDEAMTAYVIGSAFVISGLATVIQVVRVGPVGSGLLSIQGTSFSFIGVLIYAAGLLDGVQLSDAERVGVLLGSGIVGGLATVVAGIYIQRLSKVITLNVTGVTIFMLGMSLVWSAWQNLQWTVAGARAAGEPIAWVWLQAGVVVAVIAGLASRKSPWVRLISICAGLAAGLAVAFFTSGIDTHLMRESSGVLLPRWQPFPLSLNLGVVLVLLPIFLVSVTESVGDLTATSMLSRCELTGPHYWRRIRGGVLAGGVNSILAALAGTFPNTTFSQNNAVIQLTGVASRMVGVIVGVLLIALGLLPQFSALFQLIPGGVLHGATGLLFAMIAVAGLRLLRNPVANRDSNRGLRMLAGCGGAAIALSFLPDFVGYLGYGLPNYLSMLLNFPVASCALIAIVWEWRSASTNNKKAAAL